MRTRSRPLFALAALLALPACAANETSPPIAATSAAITEGLVTGPDGNQYYQTADGVLRPMVPLDPSTAPGAGASLPGFTSGVYQPTGAATPARVSLPQGPVKDQGPTGMCGIFTGVGLIEAEYIRDYGLHLDLSTQYWISLIDVNGGWGGFSVQAAMGLPPTAMFPYFYDAGAALQSLQANLPLQNTLQNDLANMNVLFAPTPLAHETAQYGASSVVTIWGDHNHENTDISPILEAMAQGYSVEIHFGWAQQKTNPNTGVWEFNGQNAWNTDGHFIILSGYDKSTHQFTFKNSWGSGWNNAGYGQATFEFVLKDTDTALFVSGVTPPSNGVLGSAAWRGFYRAHMNGVDGVAVVYRTYQSTGDGSQQSGNGNAVIFYGNDGSTTSFPTVVNGSLAGVTIAGHGARFTLQPGGDANTVLYSNQNGETANWSRCGASANSFNDWPQTFPAAANDPYVLPPCDGSTWVCCNADGSAPEGQSQCAPTETVISKISGSCAQGYQDDGTGQVTCDYSVSAQPPACAFGCTQVVHCVKCSTPFCDNPPHGTGGGGCVPGKPCGTK